MFFDRFKRFIADNMLNFACIFCCGFFVNAKNKKKLKKSLDNYETDNYNQHS